MHRIPAIRRMILSDLPFVSAAGWTVLAVAVPAAIRWLLDGGHGDFPLVSFFPFILFAALFLGWKYGAASAFLSGVVANRFLTEQPVFFYASARNAFIVALFALSCVILIYMGEMLRRLVRDQAEAARREDILKHELLHRVKNMLATVNSIASMTARHSEPEEFLDAFTGRISALGQATDLLNAGKDFECELGKLVENSIVPFRTDCNFTVSGPACNLPPRSCVPLALALHELCTNALKYGALSAAKGHVAVEWKLGGEAEDVLLVHWKERGGPPVIRGTRTGMGMLLLRRQTGLSDVRMHFGPQGVECEIEIVGASRPRP